MQAQPLSIPAARIPVTTSPAFLNTDQPNSFGSPPSMHSSASRSPSQPRARRLLAARSVLTVPPPPQQVDSNPPVPAPGIAQAAGLAHDAGNLLSALGLYCDLLRAPGVLRPEHLHYATELSLISSRSSELIRRLLAADPVEHESIAAIRLEQLPQNRVQHRDQIRDQPRADRGALEFQPTDVRRRGAPMSAAGRPALTLASVLRNLSPVLGRIAAGSACVSVCAPMTLPAMDLPAETLERITVNLVRNAAEAIRTQRLDPQEKTLRPDAVSCALHSPGQIRVALAVVAGRLQLTVEDNGPGIPPAVAAAFLQPGPMPTNTSRGFGHRIVHELVNATGGQLSIRVRPKQGTVFCIKWPTPNALNDNFYPANIPALPAPSRLTVQGDSSTC